MDLQVTPPPSLPTGVRPIFQPNSSLPQPADPSNIQSAFNDHQNPLTLSVLAHAVNIDPQAVVDYILALEQRVRALEKRVIVHHNQVQHAKEMASKAARTIDNSVKVQEQSFAHTFRKFEGLERAAVFTEFEQEQEYENYQDSGEVGLRDCDVKEEEMREDGQGKDDTGGLEREDIYMHVDEEEGEEYHDAPPSPPSPSLIRV